jgi:coenzyme F420-0:L-glutamate ligase / coenzyme F420-1:gamma-L-glutamate ligase
VHGSDKGVWILPVAGLPELSEGDDLAALIAGATELADLDVVVVAQKAVSKVEGRVIQGDKHELVAGESSRVVRRSGDLTIAETRHGFVCANAGVDASNVPPGQVSLLPLDPDLSARRLRARFEQLGGVDVAVIVSDTFGRAWRLGQTNVAIGVAGIEAFTDYRGSTDFYGNELTATRICTADELASAAELVMRKSDGICAAVIRGVAVVRGSGSAQQIVRPPNDDLFR